MTIFYIKIKIRAGGGGLGQQGGALGQQGAPPAIPLYGKHYIARGKLVCEFDFHLTVSITVVRSIEKKTNHPKIPQTTPNLHQTKQTITVYSQYHIMRDF